MNGWVAATLGLGAAFGWGSADFLAKRRAERDGGTATLLWLYLVGFPVFLGLWTLRGAAAAPAPTLALWVVVGLLNAGAYLSLYRGFRIGLLAVVTTTNAAWAAITALLAILLIGERPGLAGLAGMGTTLAGVALIAWDGTRIRLHAPGFREGLVSAGLFGVSFFLLKLPLAQGDLLLQAAVLRGTGLLLVGAAVLGGDPRSLRRYRTRPPLFALLDSAAFLAFLAGLAGGAAYVVAPLGSLLTPVAVGLAAAFYHERMVRHQWLGFALVVSGAFLLAWQA